MESPGGAGRVSCEALALKVAGIDMQLRICHQLKTGSYAPDH